MPEIYLSIRSLGAYSSQGSFRCMYAFARPPGQCEVPVHTSHESCDVSSTAAHESGTRRFGARHFTTRRLVPRLVRTDTAASSPASVSEGGSGQAAGRSARARRGRTTTLTGVPGLVHPVVVSDSGCDASTASPQNLHPACASARPDVVMASRPT